MPCAPEKDNNINYYRDFRVPRRRIHFIRSRDSCDNTRFSMKYHRHARYIFMNTNDNNSVGQEQAIQCFNDTLTNCLKNQYWSSARYIRIRNL